MMHGQKNIKSFVLVYQI